MKYFFLAFFCLIQTFTILSQEFKKGDIIYLSNGTPINGKLLAVDDDKVQFSMGESMIKTYFQDKVAIAFNSLGNYLVVSQISKDKPASQKQISDFYGQTDATKIGYDIIFKAVPFEVIPCTIKYAKDALNYQTTTGNSASINRDNVLAVILKDGSHEIIRDMPQILPILAENAERIDNLRTRTPSKTAPIPPKPGPTPVPVPPVNPEPLREDVQIPISNKLPAKLSDEEKVTYKNKSIDKVVEFKNYLNVIANRKRSQSEKSEAIKSALKLFTPGASIEVTSRNKAGAVKKPVAKYLNDLSNLNYSSVQIEYAELKLVSEFMQADDGNYYGIISGEQSFIGNDGKGNLMYSDIVNKNYKVKLEAYKKIKDNREENKWNILFGDVTISQ